jgi:hypothetical protein
VGGTLEMTVTIDDRHRRHVQSCAELALANQMERGTSPPEPKAFFTHATLERGVYHHPATRQDELGSRAPASQATKENYSSRRTPGKKMEPSDPSPPGERAALRTRPSLIGVLAGS